MVLFLEVEIFGRIDFLYFIFVKEESVFIIFLVYLCIFNFINFINIYFLYLVCFGFIN